MEINIEILHAQNQHLLEVNKKLQRTIFKNPALLKQQNMSTIMLSVKVMC